MQRVKIFDVKRYTHDQIVDALTCPLNRHATRVEHNCDDFELHRHPEWLLEHYVRCGGAEYWASKRAQYEREIEVPDETVTGVPDPATTPAPNPTVTSIPDTRREQPVLSPSGCSPVFA